MTQAWARHTLVKEYLGYRIDHRMPVQIFKNLVIQGNAIDGIRAYDKTSGQLVWEKKIKGGVELGAALAQGRLFFGANDGFFYALNAATGKVEWSYPIKSEGLGRPLVHQDMVYFMAGNNTAYALKATSGEQVWIYNRLEASPLNVRGAAEPAVDGSRVYFGFSDGYFVALDRVRGTLLWEKQLGTNIRFKDIDSKAVIDSDKIYISSYDGQLYCLNLSDGRTLWTFEEGGYTAVTVEGSHLFYSTTTGHIVSIDKNSGQEKWRRAIEKSIATQPIYYKGLLVFGEWRGRVRAIDALTGKEVSSFSTGRGVAATPVIDVQSQMAYFTSVDANLFAVRLGWVPNSEVWPWEK